ncbi:MAG: hypothetical protein JWL84_127 [Rhodospirillales bacterium]|nr:hypothetical protein [Rhodospirillales bacterium]
MNEMLVRVREAIQHAERFGRDRARAAVEALLEPTETMIAAGEKCDEGHCLGEGCASCEDHWRAMVAEILR